MTGFKMVEEVIYQLDEEGKSNTQFMPCCSAQFLSITNSLLLTSVVLIQPFVDVIANFPAAPVKYEPQPRCTNVCYNILEATMTGFHGKLDPGIAEVLLFSVFHELMKLSATESLV
jgi:hypothetical protein